MEQKNYANYFPFLSPLLFLNVSVDIPMAVYVFNGNQTIFLRICIAPFISEMTVYFGRFDNKIFVKIVCIT